MTKAINKKAVEIAVEIKNEWVQTELQEQYLDRGPCNAIKSETADETIMQMNPAIFSDPYSWQISRPRFERLNPNKGLLLFLRTIAANPGHKSFKYYLLLTGNKPTSFSDLRCQLVRGYRLITNDYQVTERGKRLLEAFNL